MEYHVNEEVNEVKAIFFALFQTFFLRPSSKYLANGNASSSSNIEVEDESS